MLLEEAVDLGKNVSLVCRDETCAVYKLRDETGEGMMTCYGVFPGVNLLYHDFHMDHCMSYFRPGVEMFCIDHCREGRLEWEMDDGGCFYMEAGDLQLNSRDHHMRMFHFPLRHYHGITVSFCVEEAASVIPGLLEGFSADVNGLREKFCSKARPFLLRAGTGIEHIFSELYSVPESIRASFFKIKALELLLFLSTLDVPADGGERPYFHKTQVEKVKAVMAMITAEPQKRYTLEELSARFEFPATSLKKCFKGVYGASIYSYTKEYRMNAAAVQLRRTGDSITSVAQQMGYDNASKFSAAFKSVIGMTPSEYRKSVV